MTTPLTQTAFSPSEVHLTPGVVSAVEQPDGSVVVDGLPFFSEVRETDPGVLDGTRQPRDRAWLEGALERHRQRAALGQFPIITLRHIFDGPQTVGHYQLTHIAPYVVNPDEEPRATIFGRKRYLSREAFEAAKDYEFRSAEVSPDKPEELGALALLKDKLPFFHYPNARERLTPAVQEAFESALVEAFRSRMGEHAQAWRGPTEVYSAARAAQTHQATKEGDMPADTTTEKKTPSLEERMEAMAAKCFEGMAKKFEAMFETAFKKGSGDAEDKTAKAGGTEKPETAEAEGEKDEKKEKKTEAAQATGGPNDQLPPAISSQRAGESFAAKPQVSTEAFAAMAAKDQTILGLKATVEKMQRREAAGALVAKAKKTLSDMGVPAMTEAFEAATFNAAVEKGEAGVTALVESVKLAMGLTARAPEAFGAIGGHVENGGLAKDHPELHKALEAFGSRPEAKARIHELYSQFVQTPEHVRRSLLGSFEGIVRGDHLINPNALGPRGGLGGRI